jgi:uncharacterized protein YjbI with pentapeptide repeats
MAEPDTAKIETPCSDSTERAGQSPEVDDATGRRPPARVTSRRKLVTGSAVATATLGVVAVSRWQMVGLAVVVLVVGLGLVAGSVWGRLSRQGSTFVAVVSEVTTDAGIALMTGAVLGLVLFAAQDRVEENRFAREQRLEEDRIVREVRRDNVRFVREVATQRDAPAKPFAGLDLQDAEFAGLSLVDADFTEADLRGANLTEANLTGADLPGADLEGADLSGADLTEVVLIGADLKGANLTGADLTGADLFEANLTRADLEDANLTGASITSTDLTRADLEGANLTGADLTGADLTGADLARVVYDDTTSWPGNFTPPPSAEP